MLRKKEPLHDYKAGGLAAVAAVLKHLPVSTNLGTLGDSWELPGYRLQLS